MADLKRQTLSGFLWATLEQCGTQIVTFVVSMVLARLLTPSDYGAVALLSIFILIAESLTNAGFGSALVQKKDATELDFNTVFFLSLSVGTVLYAVLFVFAPQIAAFFKHPELSAMFRVQALAIFLCVVSSVQGAEISRRMLFNISFRVSIIASIASAAVGLACAFSGMGPWALVWMSFSSSVVSIAVRQFYIDWRPHLMFSWSSAGGLFKFGWKIAFAGLLDTAYGNLYSVLIGRVYSSADMAFVNKGKSIPALAMNTISGPINRVSYPVLTKLQSEPLRLRDGMRKMMVFSTFLVFPAMAGLIVCAPNLIPLLFGDQWTESVVYLQLAAFGFALWPFHLFNLQGMKAIGRSDWFLILEFVKKGLGLVIVLSTVWHSVFLMMAAFAFVDGPLCVLINSWPNRKLMSYPVWMQVRDVLPSASCAILMGLIILPFNYLSLPGWLALVIQMPLGACAYLLFARQLRVAALRDAVCMMVSRFPRLSRLKRRAGLVSWND